MDQILLVTEASSSEVGGLVHIQPNSCEVDFRVELLHLSLPESGSIGIDEVCIVDLPRPYLSLVIVLTRLCTLQPDVELSSHPRGIMIVYCKANIQQRHQLDLRALKYSVELFARVSLFVDAENNFILHVVEVEPKGIQRKIVMPEEVDDPFDLTESFVAPL